MSLQSQQNETQASPAEPRVIGVDDDVADRVFEALSASTTVHSTSSRLSQ